MEPVAQREPKVTLGPQVQRVMTGQREPQVQPDLREPLVQRSAAALLSMVRVLQERTVAPQYAALFASPEPLCVCV